MASKSTKPGKTSDSGPTTPTTPAAPPASTTPAAPTTKKAETPPAAASTAAPRPVYDHELQLIAEGRHGNPHAVLGAHHHQDAVTVRVFKPLANAVTVLYAEGAETLRAELHHE